MKIWFDTVEYCHYLTGKTQPKHRLCKNFYVGLESINNKLSLDHTLSTVFACSLSSEENDQFLQKTFINSLFKKVL